MLGYRRQVLSRVAESRFGRMFRQQKLSLLVFSCRYALRCLWSSLRLTLWVVQPPAAVLKTCPALAVRRFLAALTITPPEFVPDCGKEVPLLQVLCPHTLPREGTPVTLDAANNSPRRGLSAHTPLFRVRSRKLTKNARPFLGILTPSIVTFPELLAGCRRSQGHNSSVHNQTELTSLTSVFSSLTTTPSPLSSSGSKNSGIATARQYRQYGDNNQQLDEGETVLTTVCGRMFTTVGSMLSGRQTPETTMV